MRGSDRDDCCLVLDELEGGVGMKASQTQQVASRWKIGEIEAMHAWTPSIDRQGMPCQIKQGGSEPRSRLNLKNACRGVGVDLGIEAHRLRHADGHHRDGFTKGVGATRPLRKEADRKRASYEVGVDRILLGAGVAIAKIPIPTRGSRGLVGKCGRQLIAGG